MSSHSDSFVASGSSPTPDFIVECHGSIFLLRPLTLAASSWIEFVDLGIILAREIQRRRDGNQFALVHGTNTWFILNERLELETRVHRGDPNRQQRGSGLRTLPWLLLEDSFLARRGADV